MSKQSSKRGAGPSVTQNDGRKPSFNTKRTSVEASGSLHKNTDLAKGGRSKMFSQQVAGTKAPGRSGKPDSSGPGEKFAAGGIRPTAFTGAMPAMPGHTSIFSSDDPWARQPRDYSKKG